MYKFVCFVEKCERKSRFAVRQLEQNNNNGQKRRTQLWDSIANAVNAVGVAFPTHDHFFNGLI